ncbi:DUF2849 domain-containing protein [Sandaracinobacter sp. RS1-74]|nr:DUF2849 domain-containing protein [Sandaracinobacteroides sayramensis]
MKLLTGNELTRGDVLWWTGDGWSKRISDAVAVGEEAQAIIERETPLERVNELALIDAEEVADAAGSRWRPVKARERIRAFGPTVRADLAIPGQDWR